MPSLPASETLRSAASDEQHESAGARRILSFICAVCVIEAACVQLMAPLLPHLLHELHQSKSMGGWISAAFWIGGIVGTFLPLLLIERLGPRWMTICGLVGIGISMLALGFAESASSVIAARFVGGMGGTTAWAGAYTWLVMRTPPSSRATSLATVFTATYVGLLVGPAFGAAAAELDRAVVCAVVSAGVIALALWGGRIPPPPRATRGPRGSWERFRTPEAVNGLALVTAIGGAAGAILVVAPLRMAAVGGTATAIAAVLWAAYIPRVVFSRASGRIVDQYGARAVIVWVMVVALVFLPLLVVGHVIWMLAVSTCAVVLATGLGLMTSMMLIGSRAEDEGTHVGPAFALAGGLWGVGAVIGSGAAGWAAQHLGDVGAAATVAVPCLFALALVGRAGTTHGAHNAPAE